MTESVAELPHPKRVWWRALLFALPFVVVGFIAGAYFMEALENEADATKPGFVAMFDHHMVSQHAYLQYREASYQEAQLALEAYLKLLDSPEQSQDLPGNLLGDLRIRRVESMLSWGRLAMLHERNGKGDLAESAWRRSESLARESGWRDPSRQRIRFQIERIDSREGTKEQAAAPN